MFFLVGYTSYTKVVFLNVKPILKIFVAVFYCYFPLYEKRVIDCRESFQKVNYWG